MTNCAINTVCKSIFKGEKKQPTQEKYTNIWVALINQIERNKQVLAETR